jgi:hypothetical protein
MKRILTLDHVSLAGNGCAEPPNQVYRGNAVRESVLWALLDEFRTSEGGFQALEDVVLVGSPWTANEVQCADASTS